MVTIQEISRITNFAPSTVSKALNGYPEISQKTREKILKVANELNYFPNATAKSLVKKKSNTIGVVFEVEYGLNNLFFSTILEAFRKQVEIKGYDILLLSNNTDNGLNYLNHCRSKQVDGVLIVSKGSNKDAINELLESELPVLSFDPEEEMKNSIYSESYFAIKKACRYLYNLGHKKIAFIQGDLTNYIGKTRYNSYMDFMIEIGNEPIVIKGLNNSLYTYEEGYKTMDMILQQFGLPDAVCSSSDLMALGAIAYLKDQGYKIPDDVSVIGFDDIKMCEIVHPKLSTIRQDYELIGKKACETIISMIENKITEFDPVIIDSELVIRDSCKRRR
ncbi:MAG: LacI family transcriptional regulator [Haloplasmataceae bacterium]|jgi:LacI family transcriptional regulator|nr:LacI family transcriptional regulator [Haloplasmataceae bacterium]